MKSKPGTIVVRSVMILGATVGAIFWLLFAVDQFPFFVPADHNGALVSAYTKASTAGVLLSLLSIATVCHVAGFFGNRDGLRVSTTLLTLCWLAASPRLFSATNVLESPVRSIFYAIGLAYILVGGFFVSAAQNQHLGTPTESDHEAAHQT